METLDFQSRWPMTQPSGRSTASMILQGREEALSACLSANCCDTSNRKHYAFGEIADLPRPHRSDTDSGTSAARP
jgi:hypothetical protein